MGNLLHDQWSNTLTTRLLTAAAESTENLWYLCTILFTLLMYTVASPDPDPDPDPNPRGGGQLPHPNFTGVTTTSMAVQRKISS